MREFFFNCGSSFEDVPREILSYLDEKNDILWTETFGIQVHGMDRSFFKRFAKLDALMAHFGCHRHSVFKFEPNICYGWHVDNPGRICALNMLLTRDQSYTFCGDTNNNTDFYNVGRVLYNENKFTLLNVKKHHTVYNLNNMRYLLSISFHPNRATYDDVKKYLIENNF